MFVITINIKYQTVRKKLVSWCPSVLVSWCPGVLVSWCPGVLVSWWSTDLVSYRGFPVSSLPCTSPLLEVWGEVLEVQVLCTIHHPTPLTGGLVFKSFFTTILANIFGLTTRTVDRKAGDEDVEEEVGGEEEEEGVFLPCPLGYSGVGSGCLLFSGSGAGSVEGARAWCRARGARLATLQGEEDREVGASSWNGQNSRSLGDRSILWILSMFDV